MDDDSPRALALAAMRFLWGVSADDLGAVAKEEPHGPGPLTEAERAALFREKELQTPLIAEIAGILSDVSDEFRFRGNERSVKSASHIAGDFPEWMTPHIERVFGDRAVQAMAAFAERADIDLRFNTLKTTPEKALSALKKVRAEKSPILTTAARIPAPDPSERAPAITVIPAFNKGWVEVQDLGSHIAAAAAGEITGAQVLDYCAGGGGKTLALAGLMENTGQLYAYDREASRLKPLYQRARRAGVKNLQIINPATDEAALVRLKDKMDLVFVDAPCTGAGVWRRRPDSKWRLTPTQLKRRMKEQDAALAEAAAYVKPGGALVWATCSFLIEENEDRLQTFLSSCDDFYLTPVLERIAATGRLLDAGRNALAACETAEGALRITPDKVRADGFFVALLARTV